MAHLPTIPATERTKRACQTKKAQPGKDARARLAGTIVPGALKFRSVARRGTWAGVASSPSPDPACRLLCPPRGAPRPPPRPPSPLPTHRPGSLTLALPASSFFCLSSSSMAPARRDHSVTERQAERGRPPSRDAGEGGRLPTRPDSSRDYEAQRLRGGPTGAAIFIST